jgi:hypothetical protein
MLNAALEQIDSILGPDTTPDRMNINSDLEFNDNDATEVRSVRFQAQGSDLAGAADLGALFMSSGNLKFRNASGTVVSITNGGTLASVPTSTTNTQQTTTSSLTVSGAATYNELLCNTSGGAITVTLDPASGFSSGRYFYVADSQGSAATNTITIARSGSDTLNGGTTSIVLRGAFVKAMVVRLSSSAWGIYRMHDAVTLHGATVPQAGALTTGNVLQVSGTAAVTYGALNLAGGSNYVTGELPGTNVATGTTSVRGALQLGGDVQGASGAMLVASLSSTTGVTGTVTVGCDNLQWSASTTPFIRQAASSGTGEDFVLQAQAAGGSNNDGGAVAIRGGAPTGTGVAGGVSLALGGGATMLQVHENAIGDRYINLFGASPLDVGASGDLMLFIGHAAFAPSAASSPYPSNGNIIFATSTGTHFRNSNGGQLGLTAQTTTSPGGSGWSITSPSTWMTLYLGGTLYRIPLWA